MLALLSLLSFLSIARNKISFCLLGAEVSSYNIRYLRIHGPVFTPLAFELTFLKIVIVDLLIDIRLDRCELAWLMTEVRKLHVFHLLLFLLQEHRDIPAEYIFDLLVEQLLDLNELLLVELFLGALSALLG